MTHPTAFLRYALLGDAVASGATGLLMLAGASFLTNWLGLPTGLLRGAGLVLLPYAAFVAWLGTRPHPARAAIWAVVAINVLWAIESVLLLASGWVAPTALGVAFVLAQAIVVAGFAGAQAYGLRMSAAPAGQPLHGA
jgi:hypothetical protein